MIRSDSRGAAPRDALSEHFSDMARNNAWSASGVTCARSSSVVVAASF